MVFIPFCSLQNLRRLRFVAYCKELDDLMSSKCSTVDRALRAVSWRNENPREWPSPSLDYLLESRMAADFVWIHCRVITLWGPTADMIRLEQLREWFVDGLSGYSEHQEQMLHIIRTDPKIILTYDPMLRFLEAQYLYLITLNHHARSLQREFSITDDKPCWDRDAWYLAFPHGIPNYISDYWDEPLSEWMKINALLNYDPYLEYVRSDNWKTWFAAVDAVIDDWQFRHPLHSPYLLYRELGTIFRDKFRKRIPEATEIVWEYSKMSGGHWPISCCIDRVMEID